MCHSKLYYYVVEHKALLLTKGRRRRTYYRYRILSADGRNIVTSRWRSSRTYTEKWAAQNVATLAGKR
jgi:ribosomal protein L34